VVSSDPHIEALEAKLKAGDEEALAQLFSVYRDGLRRMIAIRLDQRLMGRVSPSDVLQESYLDARQRLQHYLAAPEKSLLGWLRLIVGQRLVDLHRFHFGAQQRDVGREVSISRGVWPAASSICLANQLLAEWTSPSGAVQQAESQLMLEHALAELDPMDREILTLRHFDELSNNETADLLGIEKSAASKRYVRALARLREVLRQIPGFREQDGDEAE
jgi:RNA polymerase sigma-70 factor (ECF subfamily)